MRRRFAPLALLLAACTAADSSERTASSDTARDSIAGTVAPDSGAPPIADSAIVAAPVDTPPARQAAAAPAGADSVTKRDSTPPIPLPLIKGRSLRDSISLRSAIRKGRNAKEAWPKSPPTLPGSILPANRIIAYYGNPLSKRMGILGELPPDQMLAKFDGLIAEWKKADPSTPVKPALHLVTIVAQADPGRDGKYRLKMADTLIERVASWAQTRNALVFLDIQVGTSTIQAELPRLMKFLERPNVHLGIDPEFAMRNGARPGTKVGTYDASEINWVIRQLAQLVEEKNLPPKVLVVHRFTRPMVTNASRIELDPRVQVVMHMDGWGAPWLKFDSYRSYIVDEPVQYTGFKIFYHNDTKKGHALLTPKEVLALEPKPLYIQYQ